MYQKQAERNSTELTRKNRELVDKIQELDILKMKYEEALANYQALNTKVKENWIFIVINFPNSCLIN